MSGHEQAMRDIEKWFKDAEKSAEKAVFEAGHIVLADSNSMVPHQDGDLERSGSVSQEGLDVTVGYDTPYAVAQHEDLTFEHKNGRQAKFLETAAARNEDKVVKHVADAVREAT